MATTLGEIGTYICIGTQVQREMALDLKWTVLFGEKIIFTSTNKYGQTYMYVRTYTHTVCRSCNTPSCISAQIKFGLHIPLTGSAGD